MRVRVRESGRGDGVVRVKPEQEGVISLRTEARRFSGQTWGTRREAGGKEGKGQGRQCADPCAWTLAVAHLRFPTGHRGGEEKKNG